MSKSTPILLTVGDGPDAITGTFTGFIVTGVDARGVRFKQHYGPTNAGAMTAFGINLYAGSVWGVRLDGTRHLLKRVWN
jgi:hypothetical protein